MYFYKFLYFIKQSVGKEYESSRHLLSQRNLNNELNPFIQALPVLKDILNLCSQSECISHNRSNSHMTLEKDDNTDSCNVVEVEVEVEVEMKIESESEISPICPIIDSTALLTAAVCR